MKDSQTPSLSKDIEPYSDAIKLMAIFIYSISIKEPWSPQGFKKKLKDMIVNWCLLVNHILIPSNLRPCSYSQIQ